jgi:hypothetical protein
MEKDKKSEIHITNNFNAPIGQHIDHVDTINFRMDGDGTFHFGMVEHTHDGNCRREEAEVVEEGKEVAGGCDELLVNDVFSDELFTTNQRLLQLRTVISECVSMGKQEKIDLGKGLEWHWLYQAIYDAGLFETRSHRENVVTVVGFVRQMAKWFPDIIGVDEEERIRNICKSMSAEQGKWMMNGKPVTLVDIEANKRRMTAMKPPKIERIVGVAYYGLYTKLVALKQELLKEKATR